MYKNNIFLYFILTLLLEKTIIGNWSQFPMIIFLDIYLPFYKINKRKMIYF